MRLATTGSKREYCSFTRVLHFSSRGGSQSSILRAYLNTRVTSVKVNPQEVAEARPSARKYVPPIYGIQTPQVWQKASAKLHLGIQAKLRPAAPGTRCSYSYRKYFSLSQFSKLRFVHNTRTVLVTTAHYEKLFASWTTTAQTK